MHPKNPFIEEYNLDLLSKAYPPLKAFVFVNNYGNKTIKFADKNAVKALNTAILKQKYAINWFLPDKNLCPPIPGRLDYLLHLSDLLNNKKDVRILDIGTGANLIYPILATAHFNWSCVASEVDKESLENAKEISAKNDSLKSIDIRHQKYKNRIFDTVIKPSDYFDAVICNPPFFKNSLEAQSKNQRKVKNLNLKEKDNLNFGGKSNELWYKGGEEAFIKKMVAESVLFKDNVHWFTSLVSKKENLKNIKRAINKTNPTEVKIVDMEQGNKISRFIAWRF